MAECKICDRTDQQRRLRAGLCDGCWEVTYRLDSFLRMEKGRAYVIEALARLK